MSICCPGIFVRSAGQLALKQLALNSIVAFTMSSTESAWLVTPASRATLQEALGFSAAAPDSVF